MPKMMDWDKRKEQLAAAVWQVILDHGIGAVSVRSVAQQAGVAVGSLRHVFPTRAELMEFSARLMVQRATERIYALPRFDDDLQYALEVAKQLLPLTSDSRAELEINLALIAETPALPQLGAIRDHAHQQLEEGCVQLVEMLQGRPRDKRLLREARRLHALIDGLAIHVLQQSVSVDHDWAVDIVRRELARIEAAGV